MAEEHFDEDVDETYFDRPRAKIESFDAELMQAPVTVLPLRPALVFSPHDTATDAMRAMQREHRGCVLVTEDGTSASKLIGIFTERDVLLRVVDRGKNPASLPMAEVMTADPEVLTLRSSLAHALNKMSVGGFRHVPTIDDKRHPAFVVSVRDVVAFLVEAFPREVLTLPANSDPSLKAREGA